jgi:diguanylate cyclase (GGDEF)-like protein
MNEPSAGTRAIAVETLTDLNEQADTVRLELAQLRRNLADVQNEIGGQQSVQLLAANEQLIIAALHANTIAEAAQKTLAELVRSSQRDALTNTPNRILVLERLEGAISMARRRCVPMAVLFIDVDQLRTFNDSMGRAVGDAVLQLMVRRLQSAVRETDTIGRHGDDEFVVLLTELALERDASTVASKMLAALAAASRIDGHVIALSASIGIAVYPKDGATGAELIAAAESAMHAVKQKGGSGYAFHDDAMRSDRLPRLRGSEHAPNLATTLASPALSDAVLPLGDLQEANEQLVIAALSAHELRVLAEEAHGRQIKFMAMVAHELRNPLTPIRMAAGLLNLSSMDEARLTHLQAIIESQVTHMARLVDDLLDGSRISTGKLRLQYARIDIAAALAMSIETCRPAMQARKHHFDVTSPLPELTMRADPVRLTQIFSNLLDNACKYTPANGHIELSVTSRDQEAVITVRDNGIGITREALPHIFDLFVQHGDAAIVHGSGLGIGLAVVRELVEAHGGTVLAESGGRDQGSTFVVRLPLA